MARDLHLRRKITLQAHERQAIFVKKPVESIEHVLMKAFLWALYLPAYPGLTIEIPVGDRYKPDLVDLDNLGIPRFWGEAGKVSPKKMAALARRYKNTHFAIAKWTKRLAPHQKIIERALLDTGHTGPIDLIGFPPDSAERFITSETSLQIQFEDVTCIRI